jgi:hypothetical protein
MSCEGSEYEEHDCKVTEALVVFDLNLLPLWTLTVSQQTDAWGYKSTRLHVHGFKHFYGHLSMCNTLHSLSPFSAYENIRSTWIQYLYVCCLDCGFFCGGCLELVKWSGNNYGLWEIWEEESIYGGVGRDLVGRTWVVKFYDCRNLQLYTREKDR